MTVQRRDGNDEASGNNPPDGGRNLQLSGGEVPKAGGGNAHRTAAETAPLLWDRLHCRQSGTELRVSFTVMGSIDS
jgi:hypothetical protein